MKKFLALFLTLTMLLGVNSITSFAATTIDQAEIDVSSSSTVVLVPGVEYRYDLKTSKGYSVDKDYMKDYSITVEYPGGNNGLEYARIVKGAYGNYQLLVRGRSKRNSVTGTDVQLTTKEKRGSRNEATSSVVAFEVNGEYEEVYDDEIEVDNYRPLIEFDRDITKVSISFDRGFVVYDGKVSSGNRKFNFSYNTDEDMAIVDENPSAYMNFVSFPGEPSFSTLGSLSFNTEDSYLYEVTDNGLVKLNPSKSNGVLRLNTKKLTSYVTSDRALKDAGTSSDITDGSDITDDTTTSDSIIPINPGTTSNSQLSLTTSVINTSKREGIYAVVKLANDSLYTSGSDLYNAGNVMKSDERLILRRVNNGTIPYQWYINAKTASKVPAKFNLGINPNQTSTKNFFEKWFNNKVAVIRFAQSGNFGTTVSIAVKADVSGLNAKTLRAYRYNPDTNKYKAISNAAPYVDRAGFLHFNVSEGGDIVITDRALARR
ncbi:MAG: hypothetical protein RR806_09035 [Oscillospiraceae bacterium]